METFKEDTDVVDYKDQSFMKHVSSNFIEDKGTDTQDMCVCKSEIECGGSIGHVSIKKEYPSDSEDGFQNNNETSCNDNGIGTYFIKHSGDKSRSEVDCGGSIEHVSIKKEYPSDSEEVFQNYNETTCNDNSVGTNFREHSGENRLVNVINIVDTEPQTLEYQIGMKNFDVKPYKCDLCPLEYTRKGDLKRHVDSVHNKIRHQCEFCEKAFSQEGHLKKHVDGVHRQIKHKCILCDHEFSQKGSLKLHVESVHYKLKPHKCMICPQEFYGKGDLKRHINSVHIQVKYKCKLCAQDFSGKAELRRHIKSIHNQIKHKCELCGQQFSERGSVKKHIESIHNQIKFKCKLCSHAFTRIGGLKKHMAVIHK